MGRHHTDRQDARGRNLTTRVTARRRRASRFTLRKGAVIHWTPGGRYRVDPDDGVARAARRVRRTARPDADETVSDAEARLRTLYATMACGVLVVRADGTLTDINPAARHILGLPQTTCGDPVLGRVLAGTVRRDGTDVPLAERPIQVALRTGQPQRDLVLGVIRLDGARRWLRLDAVPIAGDDGVPTEVVCSFGDITAQVDAETALRASEERYRSVTQMAHDAIVLADEQGRIIAWNRGAEHLFGYSAPEALGQPLTRLMPARFQAAQRRGLARVAAGAAPLPDKPIEVMGRRRDGTEIAVEMSLATWTSGDRRVYSSILRDISERKEAEERLRQQALHDALTGLPNRILLRDRLEQALCGATRESSPLALFLLDLDRFKEVNDTLGHDAGDTLLRAVARRVQGALRAADTVARLGGDEFAVVLPGAEAAGAARAAEAILSALVEPVVLDGQRVAVGASIGSALVPAHGRDAATVLRRADIAMYAAKRAGGGYAVYDAAQDHHCPHRLALVSALRQALTRDELRLHYQPKVEVETGETRWAEALVRWQHPERGPLAPDQFIPLAEQTGLIAPLTRWVLDAALRDCRSWERQGLVLGVAVNVSSHNLRDPDLPETITALLERHGLPPARLRVELTESAIMADPARATAVLERIAAAGVRLAVDDFGTGHSSLAYLKQLPIDEIKLDKRFVTNMATDTADATIVASTIGLGHSLGLSFVAEGVEDAATYAQLAALRCDAAQGYHLSRPLPPDALLQWLRDRSSQPDQPEPRSGA